MIPVNNLNRTKFDLVRDSAEGEGRQNGTCLAAASSSNLGSGSAKTGREDFDWQEPCRRIRASFENQLTEGTRVIRPPVEA